ncbi:MAG: hypothetical protein RLZZ519_2650, partial [Bacteroidota bacterium]
MPLRPHIKACKCPINCRICLKIHRGLPCGTTFNISYMKKLLFLFSMVLLVACSQPAVDNTAANEAAAAASMQALQAEIDRLDAEIAADAKADSLSEAELESKGWKTLREDNYSILYPADWSLAPKGESASLFAVLSPQESRKDAFMENVNLVTEDVTNKGVDLDVYVESAEPQIVAAFEDAEILENERIKSGTREYHKMVYKAVQMGFSLVFEQYYFIVGNTAYVLTFT